MRKLVATIALVFALTGPASAAIVYLKDGSQVRGTVVSATARNIRLHTPDGVLNIEADRIIRVDYAEQETTPPVPPERPSARARPDRDEPAEAPRQLFSIGLGLANPLSRVNFSSTGGGSSDNGDTGLTVGAQYSYYLTPRLGAGFDLEYLNRSRTASQSLVPSAGTDVYGHTLLLLATLRYTLTNRGSARPYLLAGIGTNRTSTIAEATPLTGFQWDDTLTSETRTLVDDTRWGLATSLRFGIDFMLADPALFSLEFGWTGIENSDYPATAAGQDLGLEKVTGDLDLLTIGARWGWRF